MNKELTTKIGGMEARMEGLFEMLMKELQLKSEKKN